MTTGGAPERSDVTATVEPLITVGVRPLVAPFALMGRRVLLERPSFEGVAIAFERCGVPVLRAELDEALRRARPAREHLLWITSPWRNPDGWSLESGDAAAADTVEQLAEFVREGGILVQNETYRHFGPPASAPNGPRTTTDPVQMRGDDAVGSKARPTGPTRVPGAYVVGSMAKLAGPWSRLGWLLAPAALPEPLVAHLRAAAPPTLWQEAWARFAVAGGLDRLAERAAAIGGMTARAATDFGGAPLGGTSVLLDVDSADPVGLLDERYGLRVGGGADFGAGSGRVRLCFLGCGPECDHGGVEALARSGIARIAGARRVPAR